MKVTDTAGITIVCTDIEAGIIALALENYNPTIFNEEDREDEEHRRKQARMMGGQLAANLDHLN